MKTPMNKVIKSNKASRKKLVANQRKIRIRMQEMREKIAQEKEEQRINDMAYYRRQNKYNFGELGRYHTEF